MANLQKQTIQIDFGDSGIDTKTQSKLIDSKHMVAIENARTTLNKTIGKRFGTVAVGALTATYAAQKLLATENEVVALAPQSTGIPGGADYATMRTFGNADWQQISNSDGSTYGSTAPGALFAECNTAIQDVVRNNTTQGNPDSASVAHPTTGEIFTLTAWEPNTPGFGVEISVYNRTTGSVVLGRTLAQNGTRPKCLAVGNGVILIGAFDTDRIRINTYDVTTGAIGFSVDTMLNASAAVVWDWALVGGVPFAAYNSTVAPLITVQKLTTAGVKNGAPVTIAEAATNAIAVGTNSANRVRVFYHNGTQGLRHITYDTSLAIVQALHTMNALTTTIESLAGCEITFTLGTGKKHLLFAQRTAATPNNRTVECYESSEGGNDLRLTQRQAGIASKIFSSGRTNFIMLVHESTLQSTFFLYQWWSYDDSIPIPRPGKLLPCARIAYGVAGGLQIATPASLHSLDGTLKNLVVAATKKNRLVSTNGTFYTQKGICELSFNFPTSAVDWNDKKTPATHNSALKMASGFLSSYDGIGIRENGWFLYPEVVTVTPAAAGGLLADGTYSVAIVYESIDSKGNVAESTPSVIVNATITGGGGAGQLTIVFNPYRHGVRSGVQYAIYVSDANLPNVLYRVTNSASTFTSPTADQQQFVLNAATGISNAVLVANQTLYTTGGVLPNFTPDGPIVMFRHQRNIFVDDPLDATIMRYSKIQTAGQELAFSDQFTLSVPAEGGRVKAGIEMDGKVVLFKERSIFVSYGQGVSDTGSGQGFSYAQKIRSDVGCTGPQMLCEVPNGILFRSDKGIYLLGRDLNVSYAGADVDVYSSTAVRSFVNVKDLNEVRISLDDNATVLVYNYDVLDQEGFGRWFVYKNYPHNSAVVDPRGIYMIAANVSARAVAYRETINAFADNHVSGSIPANIVTSITTPWYKFANIAGLMRTWKSILTMSTQPVNLKTEVAYDYEEGVFNETHTLNANATASKWRPWFLLKRSRCTAAQLRITDSVAGTVIAGDFQISGVAFECGILPGSARLPTADSA